MQATAFSIGLFPYARDGPIVTPLRTGWKFNVISKEFIETLRTMVFTCSIATLQTIFFKQFVVLQYCKLPGNYFDFPTGPY